MRSNRTHAVLLVLLMGVFALVAQLAGVSGSRSTAKAAKQRTLAVVPGGSVPDITSTTLAKARIKARAGETIRMNATASLRVRKARRGGTQVVCGIRYSRDKDPSWSLGTPYETVPLKRAGARTKVTISRSFEAPAADTYRMSTACHVAAPERGARVTATGTIKPGRGLPKGAAVPVQ